MRAVLLLLLMITGLDLSKELDAQAQELSSSALSAGDSVRIQVWRHEELSGSYVVAPDGSLRHPLYRDLRVTGLPMAAVESRLREFLSLYETTPQFIFEPRFRVSVVGEVEQPSIYSFGPEVTVAQAVEMAGGPSASARVDRARLHRDGTEVYVDLTRPYQGLAASTVQSGDRIVVDRRSDILRSYVVPILGYVGSISSIVSLISFLR